MIFYKVLAYDLWACGARDYVARIRNKNIIIIKMFLASIKLIIVEIYIIFIRNHI